MSKIPPGFRAVDLTGPGEFQCENFPDGPAIIKETEHGAILASMNADPEDTAPAVTLIGYLGDGLGDVYMDLPCATPAAARELAEAIARLSTGPIV